MTGHTLSVERPWSALARPFLFSTNKLCWSSISGTVGSFQSGEAVAGRRALTIVCSLMSGCGQGHELRESMKEPLAQVSSTSSQQKWKYESYKVSIASKRSLENETQWLSNLSIADNLLLSLTHT